MKKSNTKDKILEVALELFSKKGFNTVSVREISGTVGIKESSLYCHFKNKRDILDTIISNYVHMNEKYVNNFSEQVEIFLNINEEQFLNITLESFNSYMVHDSVLKFFRILSIERFNSEEINNLYVKYLIDDPVEYQSQLFKILMENRKMKSNNPELLAMEFYSPIFLILQRYFLQEAKLNADKIDYLRELIKKHCLNFWKNNKSY